MKIKEIKSQHRRDFLAIYECEHCGQTTDGPGYDDTYFHQKVLPARRCSVCGKTAPESYQPRVPKYPDGYQV